MNFWALGITTDIVTKSDIYLRPYLSTIKPVCTLNLYNEDLKYILEYATVKKNVGIKGLAEDCKDFWIWQNFYIRIGKKCFRILEVLQGVIINHSVQDNNQSYCYLVQYVMKMVNRRYPIDSWSDCFELIVREKN